MKVENRKLFSNRDARSKLANMGGIMTSSPELMGEAQRFAEGSKDAVAANNDESAYLRLGTRMPVEESGELVKKIAEQSSRLGGFDESQGLTEGDLKSAITTVYFDSIRLIERLKRDPKLPASQVSDERLQALLMKRLTNMFGVDESIINETIAEVQPAAVAKNQAIPFSEQSPFRINPYRDFDKRSIADGIMSADPRRTRPSNEEVMALQGFTGTRAPVESPFVQESVDQLGAPSLLQQFRQTEMPSNRLGGSPDSDVLRTESPQGLGLESLDLVRPSGELSIDQMMNSASTRSAPAREGIETLSAPTAEFVPRFPGDTQFQQDMVARDQVAPSESEQLLASSLPMNVAADSGPESGMFYDDVKGGFNIMPPAAYDAETPAAREARILAESMALIAERSPEAIARINAGTSISSRVNNIVEPVEAQAQTFPDIKPGQGYGREAFGSGNIFTSGQQPTMTESEQLLAVAPVAEQASLPMNVAADSGPESGMFSDDVKGGFNIMPPPPYDAEPRSNILASQQDAQRMMEINATPPATPPDGYQIITNRSGAPQSVNQRRINPDKIAKITKRFANGEITEAQYQGQKKEYDNAILQDNAHKAYSADQQAVTDAATAKADAEQAAILEATLDSRIAEAEEKNDTALVEALRETKKTPSVDPKFDEIDDGTGTDFKQIIDLTAAQKVVDPLVITKGDGKDGTATGGNGNSVANSFLGTSGTPTENVAKYEARFKDMLGIKDEDKAKEMWHNMSMIGFAIAAGQDPNALANVANGMLAGTKMMKEDRASDKALMAKANIAAFDAEREDLRDAETFRQQKILAGMKSTAAFRSSRNPDEFRQNQYTAAFKQFGEAVGDALTGRKPPADALPGESQEQYAQRKGDLAYDYAVRNSGTASAGPAAGPAVGDTLNDVNLGPLVFTEKNGWQKA